MSIGDSRSTNSDSEELFFDFDEWLESFSEENDTASDFSMDNDWDLDFSSAAQQDEEGIISVLDVADYILLKLGKMSTMKLQKLVYYSQVWSLVWDEKPLFSEPIEAWANGPVVRKLFDYHKGYFRINRVLTGNPERLNLEQKETVDSVIEFYGEKTAQYLIDLTHIELPWKKTRGNLPTGERGSKEIPLDLIADYYSSL